MPHHRLRLRQIEQTGGKASHYPDHGQQIRALAQMLAGIEAYGLDSPAKTVGQAKPVADSGKHLRRPGRKAGEIEGEPQTQHFQPIRIGGGHIAYREWECATPGRIGKAHDILRRRPVTRGKKQRQALLGPRIYVPNQRCDCLCLPRSMLGVFYAALPCSVESPPAELMILMILSEYTPSQPLGHCLA